jgi:hypothetical protein
MILKQELCRFGGVFMGFCDELHKNNLQKML